MTQWPKVIIKIGTNILTTPKGQLDLNNLRQLVHKISQLKLTMDIHVIIVSSGSITCGAQLMNIVADSIPERQAAAAVGQFLLMQQYSNFFEQKGLKVGQILLTKDSFIDPIRKNNAKNTISTLLSQGIIPIINENDSVATDEIDYQFDDNDDLSSKVAYLLDAEQLIILTDIDGLFTENPFKNPKARLIKEIELITKTHLSYVKDISSRRSRGGMKSKLLAAKFAMAVGIKVVIANGRKQHIINTNISGHSFEGTICLPQSSKSPPLKE